MHKTNSAKMSVLLSMFIYGTIGIFVRYMTLPSAVISMIRGVATATLCYW